MTTGAKKLSSTVLEMKFMQRTKRKLEARERKKQEAEMKKNCFGNEDGTSDSGSKRPDFEFSNDLTVLEGLKFGRMSFKGCNPEVEKLMVYYERKMNGESSDSDSDYEKDVGDIEMATTLRGGAKANKNKSIEVILIFSLFFVFFIYYFIVFLCCPTSVHSFFHLFASMFTFPNDNFHEGKFVMLHAPHSL
ncbi:hypothetical protein V3C99_012311, partial [Haemonchus contortus]